MEGKKINLRTLRAARTAARNLIATLGIEGREGAFEVVYKLLRELMEENEARAVFEAARGAGSEN